MSQSGLRAGIRIRPCANAGGGEMLNRLACLGIDLFFLGVIGFAVLAAIGAIVTVFGILEPFRALMRG